MSRVYDDRTDETLFNGENMDCVAYIHQNYDEDSEDFEHIWIGKAE